MRKKQIFYFFFLFSTLSLLSQKNRPYEYNLSSYQNYFKRELGITIKIPEKFKSNLNKYFQYWKVREAKEKMTGHIYGPFFITKDKNCMLALPYDNYAALSRLKKDKTPDKNFYFYAKGQLVSEILTSVDLCNGMCGYLRSQTEKEEFSKYVEVVFGKKAKEKYNANAYAIYDLPNANKTYFFDEDLEKLRKEKFPYCTSLFIQKDKRAVLNIKIYFTEKGFKKKEKYIKMLDKHIWFDENFKPKKEE
jgi:hypothetical protein